ncbi:MAG: hypothetical protein ABI193_08595 [Minicystis sp.]
MNKMVEIVVWVPVKMLVQAEVDEASEPTDEIPVMLAAPDGEPDTVRSRVAPVTRRYLFGLSVEEGGRDGLR